MKVNIAVCGIFHYRKYIGQYSRSGQLQRFYYAHKMQTTAKTLGIDRGAACNLWLKEYAMAFAGRTPTRWRMGDRIGLLVHRHWESQLMNRWIASDLFHLHLLGTAERVLEKARRDSTVTVGEPVMSHPTVLNEIVIEEHDILGLAKPRSVGTLFNRLQAEIPLCDYLVAGSSSVRDSYVRMGYPAERFSVIPYGVDLERFYPLTPKERAGAEDGKFRVICVAQITPRKGIHYLLEAWRRMRLPPNEAELLLIGPVDGTMEAIMKKYEGIYTHMPRVPHERLREHYGQSSVFVLPSVEDGFGYVTAEAMGCGLPVIVSRAAGSADMVEEGGNGWVVPPRSIDALQEKLDVLYRDESLRRTMGNRSRELSALKYRWSDYASQLAAHHKKLVASCVTEGQLSIGS
jgi:glycosyltransferase involved in cell wall biosynthesis